MLEFRLEDHSYWLDGVRLPSVTQVLSEMGFYGDAAAYFTEYSRDRGTYVHKAIQLYEDGELDEESLDPVIRPYLKAWKQFKHDSGFIVSASEKAMASVTYQFAGTVDLLGTFEDTTCAIIDIKTGAVGPVVGLQLAAYEILEGTHGRKRFALQLKEDGKYKLHQFTNRQDRQIFLSALSVYQWKKANLK